MPVMLFCIRFNCRALDPGLAGAWKGAMNRAGGI